MYAQRMADFRARLTGAGFDTALITDDDTVYYLTGYYDYLHMDFGRPTVLVVPRDGGSVLITPSMEMDMAEAAARVDRIAAWNDGAGDEWRGELAAVLSGPGIIAYEPDLMPQVVQAYVTSRAGADRLRDVTPLVSDGRLVPTSMVTRALFWSGFVWTGLTGLIGWLIFRGRELARVTV